MSTVDDALATTACVPVRGGAERSRDCPVCRSPAHDVLFDNAMASIAGIDFSYPVVACRRCGMVYAAAAPEAATLQRYYASLSKYDHPAGGDRIDAGNQHRAVAAAAFTRRCVGAEARVLDVGCSIGVYLSVLSGAGQRDVRGLDPSSAAAAVAQARFGIDVDVGSADEYAGYADFDAIALLAVLEHLREPGALLESIARRMRPGAMLIVEVPDADRFQAYPSIGHASEPFGEFSNEHINFFGHASLCRIAADFGLSCVASEPLRYLAGFDGLLAAFRKGPHPAIRESRPSAVASVRRYVRRSSTARAAMEARLARAGLLERDIVLYGAGSHSARMLAQGALGDTSIAVVLDRNPHLAGETIGRFPIAAPTALARWPGLPVVVSSFHAMNSIASYLREHFDNAVFTFYPEPPVDAPLPPSMRSLAAAHR